MYRITNLLENKHYCGVRSSKISPFDDLGTKYFGSPSSKENKWIINDQKDNKNNYKYKIIKTFQTRELSEEYEQKYHEIFDVSSSPNFYNSTNANKKFKHTKRVVIRLPDNSTMSISTLDLRWINKEFPHVNKGITHKKRNSKETRERKSKHMKENHYSKNLSTENHPNYGSKRTEEQRKNISAGLILYCETNGNSFSGKTHNDETKEKISKKNKGKLAGDKNPMFGRKYRFAKNKETGIRKKIFEGQLLPENYEFMGSRPI